MSQAEIYMFLKTHKDKYHTATEISQELQISRERTVRALTSIRWIKQLTFRKTKNPSGQTTLEYKYVGEPK